MEKIIGYQYSETGGHGYYFYRDFKQICTVSTGLFLPVRIAGFSKEWISKYDMYNTVMPGSVRNVRNDVTEEVIHKITYLSRGKFIIDDRLEVSCEEGKYTFTRPENRMLVADITKCTDEDIWIPEEEWRDFEPYFEISLHQEVEEDEFLLIAGFPALRFGLT